MKLWGDGKDLNRQVEDFTVGKDHLLDLELVRYDCLGSIAHARMLAHVGLLPVEEADLLVLELENVIRLAEAGSFPISKEQEDCHTAIEEHLIAKLGDTGKKLHTGRSRNDQVLTALRLYYKDRLDEQRGLVERLLQSLKEFITKFGKCPIPGFTHSRKAMPSTIRMWAGALVDSMKDNLKLLNAAYRLIDQSPLGSGAGYGVPLDIDRRFTARELGFARVQKNPVYVQNSRGKFEATVLHVLAQMALDLNRAASDLIVFSMPEFGYFHLPAGLCTGSSIMPQKQNPDVLELVRAKYHQLLACEMQVKATIGSLLYGYHRDLQLTKEPVMTGLAIAQEVVSAMCVVLDNLEVDEQRCRQAMTGELYAAEEAYRLVQRGVPFREAYRQVKEKLKDS